MHGNGQHLANPQYDRSTVPGSANEPAARIGYFTSYYPAISHTFIRREIQALEKMGVTIFRYAMRSAPEKLVDPVDIAEQAKSRHIVDTGIVNLAFRFSVTLLRQPVAMFKALTLAAKIGWHSDRGILLHLVFVAEAAVLAQWCRRDAIDHLHVHFGTTPAAIAMFAKQFSGVPFSFTAHGSAEFELAPVLALEVKLRHSTFAVCVSSFGRSQLMRWSPPAEWKKIELVHCGLGGDFLTANASPIPSAPRFVCVGRLSEEKAQLLLVAAARRLRDMGHDFQLVLAGDGPMRQRIEAAIRDARLTNQITITGWISGERVKAEIAAARALVLPSFAENMPIVIMEAMALGRPIISTYVGGIPEMVEPEKTGWLVPASDEAALADAMREALAASPDRLAAMGAAGRERIIERHDAAKEAQKLNELFDSALRRATVSAV